MCRDSRGTCRCSSSSEVTAVSTVVGVLDDETRSESERDPESESESDDGEQRVAARVGKAGRAGTDMVYSVSRCSARIRG